MVIFVINLQNLSDLTSAAKPEDWNFLTVFRGQNSHESYNSKIWKLINWHNLSKRLADNRSWSISAGKPQLERALCEASFSLQFLLRVYPVHLPAQFSLNSNDPPTAGGGGDIQSRFFFSSVKSTVDSCHRDSAFRPFEFHSDSSLIITKCHRTRKERKFFYFTKSYFPHELNLCCHQNFSNWFVWFWQD